MGVVKKEIKIQAKPEALWDVFADLRRLPDWLTLHVKFKTDPPAPEDYAAGVRVTQVISMMGMPNTIEWTVQSFEKLKEVTITGTGMAGVKLRFTFGIEQADGAAIGKLDAEFTGQIIVGALGKALEEQASKELNSSLNKLAEVMVEEGAITADQRAQVEINDPPRSAAPITW